MLYIGGSSVSPITKPLKRGVNLTASNFRRRLDFIPETVLLAPPDIGPVLTYRTRSIKVGGLCYLGHLRDQWRVRRGWKNLLLALSVTEIDDVPL